MRAPRWFSPRTPRKGTLLTHDQVRACIVERRTEVSGSGVLAARLFADLIGKPYQRGGRGPEAYDCAGLVVEMQRRQGFELTLPETGVDGSGLLTMRRILGADWSRSGYAFPGCIVFFSHQGHVGTMIDRRRFLHVGEQVGDACVESLESPYWCGKSHSFHYLQQVQP